MRRTFFLYVILLLFVVLVILLVVVCFLCVICINVVFFTGSDCLPRGRKKRQMRSASVIITKVGIPVIVISIMKIISVLTIKGLGNVAVLHNIVYYITVDAEHLVGTII